MTRRRLRSSITFRILVLAGLDDRIDGALVQESQELRRLIQDGTDLETGEPFRGVRRILEVFLKGTCPPATRHS